MKTPEEMFYEWRQAFHENLYERLTEGEPIESLSKEVFLAGYKAAQQEYEAKIQELETQLENWQHNAVHGDEGL
jgi:hypothetical protein